MVAYYWLRRNLRVLHTTILLWIFFRLGTKLFDYVRTHDNNYGRCTAMFFAQSEREAIIAARAFVEWLDKEN